MGAEFYSSCLFWPAAKFLDYNAGKRVADMIEDVEERQNIVKAIGFLEDLNLQDDSFCSREANLHALGPVMMLLSAYQGYGAPTESNAPLASMIELEQHPDVLAAIGFSQDAYELIRSLIGKTIGDECYLKARLDAERTAIFALDLSGLTALSPRSAENLAKHNGNLYLNGLTLIKVAVAEALAKHEGFLSLEGVTELSDEAIQSLAKHKGALCLDGLTALSDSGAEALAKHQGSLAIDGVGALSKKSAKALAKHADDIGGMDASEWVASRTAT
jgi:hypothetical protein